MLTDQQKEFFDSEGYLVIENVLDEETVLGPVRAEYSALLDRLYDGWAAEGRVPAPAGASFQDKLLTAYRAGCDWFQPMDISLPGDKVTPDTPFHFGPAIFDLLTSPALLDIAEDLIGPEITSNPIQHVRLKSPAGDLREGENRAHITLTDWHQDRGVTHAEADRTSMITVWCAVTDATEQNGCLKVIPGAHRQGMLPHCPKLQTAIADGFIDEGAAVPLPVKAGGIVIFHPLVPHASLVNCSDSFRWSFDIRYNRTGEPTGRSQFPSFVARSRSNPQSELRDWREWQAMWENARARLAGVAHIPIHRWTSDSPMCA